MSYTLRQVQPLLTKPELELFQASRAGAISEFSPKRLASKIQRARALRDKYRDVYQRQTVQTRKGAPPVRNAVGGENTRTQTKSEVMDEVLKRFEAQHDKLQRKLDAAASPARAPKAVKANKATASVTTKAAAKSALKPATKTATGAAKKSPTKTAATPPAKVAKKASAKSASKPAAKKPARKRAVPAPVVPTLEQLVNNVRNAVAHMHDADSAPTGHHEPSDTAPPHATLASAPTDMPAVAQRMNPLKALPVNKSMYGSERSRTRAAQGKRDARKEANDG
ncbi:hypothetical protein [Hydrogenophaga sp.]|uniref:hypothetical protein n=1 Tax=Hydrogenophaga sp. TaxID=1904254 RepID=UPI0027241E0E|nr:hypothetical protein [Hydrogenophaga sp.]MDO9438763.1 hypothetical protein [Hydrogenophaga sp.]